MAEARSVALIADDDEFFRIALRTILTSELDFPEVVETASLDDAIEQLAARDDISLALFDLAMPGMESPASLRAVRDVKPELTVAVVSASSSRSHILTALEAGVHGYVPKGLGAGELTSALRQISQGVIYVPPAIAERTPPGEESEAGEFDDGAVAARGAAFLTPRQRQVLALLVQGYSNKEIARKLDLGPGTVKIHLAALFRNLGVRNRQAAAAAGARLMPEIGEPEQ